MVCCLKKVEVREQMTNVFAHRDVFEPHLRRDGFGRQTAHESRERFELTGRESQSRGIPRFSASVRLRFY